MQDKVLKRDLDAALILAGMALAVAYFTSAFVLANSFMFEYSPVLLAAITTVCLKENFKSYKIDNESMLVYSKQILFSKWEEVGVINSNTLVIGDTVLLQKTDNILKFNTLNVRALKSDSLMLLAQAIDSVKDR